MQWTTTVLCTWRLEIWIQTGHYSSPSDSPNPLKLWPVCTPKKECPLVMSVGNNHSLLYLKCVSESCSIEKEIAFNYNSRTRMPACTLYNNEGTEKHLRRNNTSNFEVEGLQQQRDLVIFLSCQPGTEMWSCSGHRLTKSGPLKNGKRSSGLKNLDFFCWGT